MYKINEDDVNTVVVKVAEHCKRILHTYQNNPEHVVLEEEPITVGRFSRLQIKSEIKDNKLNIYLLENEGVFYFPQKAKLLSVDLTKQLKIYIDVMHKVLSSKINPYRELYKSIR